MTQIEEIRFHNLFIKFKNEDKGLDEIKDLLKLDNQLLNDWNERFEAEKYKIELRKPNIADVHIVGMNSNGEYIYDNIFNFEFDSDLEIVLFELDQILLNGEKEWADLAKKHKEVFLKYFTKLSIQYDNKNIITNFDLKINDETTLKKANEAVRFYNNYFAYKILIEESLILKETSKDYFTSARNILPFALKSLKIKNFDGIIQTGYSALPIDTNWIFLIGENGYGKTTLLRSIAIGFIGDEDSDAELFKPYSDNGIGIEYFNQSRSIIHNVGDSFKPFPHLACYGPSRLQVQTDQTQNDIAKKSTTTYSLFNADGILLNIEYELLIWYLEKSPKFEAVKNTVLFLNV